mgnify:CR=1 FL=1
MKQDLRNTQFSGKHIEIPLFTAGAPNTSGTWMPSFGILCTADSVRQCERACCEEGNFICFRKILNVSQIRLRSVFCALSFFCGSLCATRPTNWIALGCKALLIFGHNVAFRIFTVMQIKRIVVQLPAGHFHLLQ